MAVEYKNTCGEYPAEATGLSRNTEYQRYLWCLCLLLLALLIPDSTYAQSCRATVNDIEFGDISNISQQSYSVTGTIELRCNPQRGPRGVPARVCLHLPNTFSGASGSRYMWGPFGPFSTPVQFQLYQDAARTQLWGSGIDAMTVDTPPLGSGNTRIQVNFYAEAFAGQSPNIAGNYSSGNLNIDTTMELGSNRPCAAINSNPRTTSFRVNANVGSYCDVNASDLIFPSTTSLDSPLNGSSQVRLMCTLGVSYSVSLDGGQVGAGINNRMMGAGGAPPGQISYQLYRDPGRNTVWGDGTQGSTLTGFSWGISRTSTVYGTIPAQATPPAGAYSDAITVTVTF